jgi:hypothetical protein
LEASKFSTISTVLLANGFIIYIILARLVKSGNEFLLKMEKIHYLG